VQPGQGGRSLAEVWNQGTRVMPQRMVTHTWSGRFLDLVSSCVADALGRQVYEQIALLLSDLEGITMIKQELAQQRQLDATYWICAISVNQHATICDRFGCECGQPKHHSQDPVHSEVNKFDDMMAHLAERQPGFGQIVAIDNSFRLFSRAWCVAELIEAEARSMPQRVVLHSESVFEEHFEELSMLDVRLCSATQPEDKDFVLRKHPDLDAFNARLQWLLFSAGGMFGEWVDARAQCAIVGRIARRHMRR